MNFLKKYQAHFRLMGFVSFTALAATTLLTAYKAFSEPIMEMTGEVWYWPALIATLAMVYFLVDHGLQDNLANYIRHRRYMKQLSRKEKRKLSGITSFIFLLLLFRIVMTGTASIWAGDEIGAWMHQGDPTAQYVEQIEQNNEASASRSGAAQEEYEALAASEADRIAAAEAKGNALISKAVRSGSIHQRAAYKANPGYFSPPPRGKYYETNKKYGERIAAAKAEAAALIAAEKQKTAEAKALFYGMANDTTTLSINSTLGEMAAMKAAQQAQAQNRHTNIIKGLDWAFLVLGIFSVIIVVRIEDATGEQPDSRDFGVLFSMLFSRWYIGLYEWVEEILGIDLDGNGEVGSVGTPSSTPSQPAAPVAAAPPAQSLGVQWVTPPQTAYNVPEAAPRVVVKGFYSGDSDHPEEPKPALANISKSLANVSAYENDLKIKQLIGAFKHARKNWHAWKNHLSKVEAERSKRNAEKRMEEYMQLMEENIACLVELGADLTDIEIPEQ